MRRMVLIIGLFAVGAACGGSSSDVSHCPVRERTCNETLLVTDGELVALDVELKPEAGLSDDELRARFLSELSAMGVKSEAVRGTGRYVTLSTDRAGFAAICASPHVALAAESGPVCAS